MECMDFILMIMWKDYAKENGIPEEDMLEMAENMFCNGQKTMTEEGKKNYEKIFNSKKGGSEVKEEEIVEPDPQNGDEEGK